MKKSHVLVVDDEPSIRSLLVSVLDRSGYRVTAAGDGDEALAIFAEDPPDFLFVDMRMPGMGGDVLSEKVLATDQDAVIVVLTGHGTIETAVELMRQGVFSVLTKPCGIDEIVFMADKALRERTLRVRSRELERRLEMSERLAMIGKLAAGVAHELNSPLDGVIRFVRLTMESLAPETEAMEFQEEALSGLTRMSSIVKDLLTFSRNVALEIEEEGLEHLLRDAGRQVLAAHPEARVELVYDVDLSCVSVPRGMYQVFQNLLKNALDAVEGEGRVVVRAGLRNGEIQVSVTDDGCGIPEKLKDRVFEPFFTTKPVGSGTGLGLSIVSRIMERFGGGIEIDTTEGEGTTVTVSLPAKLSGSKEKAVDPFEEEADAQVHRTAG